MWSPAKAGLKNCHAPPYSSLFFFSPQSRNTSLGPLSHSLTSGILCHRTQDLKRGWWPLTPVCKLRKKRLPEEISICKGLADRTIFGCPLTCTVKQINHLIQEKLLTGKPPQFGDPQVCLHTVDVLVHLWITPLLAAFYEDEKTWLPLVKIKIPVCKYCCSAFLPGRALLMSGNGSMIREILQGALSRGHAGSRCSSCQTAWCVHPPPLHRP